MHDKLIGQLFSQGERRHTTQFTKSGKAINEKVRHFNSIGEALIDARRAQADPYAAIEVVMPWDKFVKSVEEAGQLARPVDFDYLDLLDSRYGQLRKYTPKLIETFEFKAAAPCVPLLKALDLIKELNAASRRRVPDDAPVTFVKPRWEKHVFKDGGINRHYYEMCVFSELRSTLRSGDMWVVGSRQYKDFEDYLLPRETWQKLRQTGEIPVAVDLDFATYIAERRKELHDQLKRLRNVAEVEEVVTEPLYVPGQVRAESRHVFTGDITMYTEYAVYAKIVQQRIAINRGGKMKRILLVLFCVSFLIGCSSTKHDGLSTGNSPTNHQNGSSIPAPPDGSGPSGPHPGSEEVKTISVDTARLNNLKQVILPQALPDGSLYFIGLSQEGKCQVLYLAPGAEHPAVYAVSKYPDGQISEVFVNEQWVTWVDLSGAMDWSLYIQRRGTTTIQKVASSDDQGTAKKGVDPLSPRIDDGKLVFVEPGPGNATNIVGIDIATGVRVRFTTSGLASLPSISDGHILYGEIHTDGRAGGIWWMTSWENETRTNLFDTLVYPPELVYPMLAVYMMEGERRLRIENLADHAYEEIPIPGAYDVIYDLSQEYLVWHKTVDGTISALRLSDGSRYTIVGPADYRILRPKVKGKTLLFEGYNQSDEWALFTVELP